MTCKPCHHTHTTGSRCGSPALRGEEFCFFHHPTRRPPQRSIPHKVAFTTPPLTDHEDVQMALSEVLRRVADNTLDNKRAPAAPHHSHGLRQPQRVDAVTSRMTPVRTQPDRSGPTPGLGPALTTKPPGL